jgi:integrase
VVSLPGLLVDELRESVGGSAKDDGERLVITSPEEFAIRPPNFMRRFWYPACAEAGIEAMPHDLRASYATWSYDMGSSPVETVGVSVTPAPR